MHLGRWRGVSAAALMAAGLLGAHGCQGKQRPFGVTGESSGVVDDGSEQGVDPLLPDESAGDAAAGANSETGPTRLDLLPTGALGSACAIDSGCNSGFCVAGRCCDSRCDGVCSACSEGGLCQQAPDDDTRCPVIPCAEAANTCATFAETQTTSRCQSLGVCKTQCDPVTVALDTACAEVAPGIEGVCNDAGDCVDPRSAFGAPCQSDIDCAEGSCVDGVCCREACGGACESCDATGTCVEDPGGTSCGDGLQCFGRGACLSPDGSVCQTAAECGSGNCEPAVGGGSACCSQACPDGQLCNGDGACVSPESDLGNACTSDAQCIGGRCFDGVCCDSECGAACETCAAPGREGRCSAAAVGSNDPQCPSGRQCAGRGQCLLPLGAACSLNGDCRSGECGPALQGGGEICCEAVCANGQRCSAAGSCVNAPRADGSTCTANGECLSNSCVAGRCCESACNGVCQACSGLGDCNLSPGNDARCPAVDCPTSNTVCVTYPADVTTNLCASFGVCRTAQQECRPRFANAGTLCENVAPGVRGSCDGSGNCRDPRVGLGSACSAGSECLSGNCTSGPNGTNICCNTACSGVCEGCGANGSCGFRDNGRCPAGQECASQTTCQPRTAPPGGSCATGEVCENGRCINGVCLGACVLVANGVNDGSRYDQCVLGE
jgi:hypothetical protein